MIDYDCITKNNFYCIRRGIFLGSNRYKGIKDMVRHKWILKVRNQLASLAMECDSAAAIEGAKMNSVEREALQERLRECVRWIDSLI